MSALTLPLALPMTGAGKGIAAQTRSCLTTLAAALKSRGSDRSQLLFCVVKLLDLSEKPLFNEEYSNWFGDDSTLPARAVVGVFAADLPAGARLAISATAALPTTVSSSAGGAIRRLQLVPGLFHLVVEFKNVYYLSGVSAELETGEEHMPSDVGEQVANRSSAM